MTEHQLFAPTCQNGVWICLPRPCGTGGTSGGGESTGGAAGATGGEGPGSSGAGGSAGDGSCSRVTTDGASQQTLAELCARKEDENNLLGAEPCPASVDQAMATFAKGPGFSSRSSGCGYTLVQANTPFSSARYYFDATSGALFAAFHSDDTASPPCNTFAHVGGSLPVACATSENCVFARGDWLEDEWATPPPVTWPWCDGFGPAGGAGGAAGAGGGGTSNGAGASAGGSAGAP